jgi:hypothetical protein
MSANAKARGLCRFEPCLRDVHRESQGEAFKTFILATGHGVQEWLRAFMQRRMGVRSVYA